MCTPAAGGIARFNATTTSPKPAAAISYGSTTIGGEEDGSYRVPSNDGPVPNVPRFQLFQLLGGIMQLKNFEDFEIWKEARGLSQEIYTLSTTPKFSKDFALRDQMRRAAVSIMSNIAEGFERGG